VQQWSEFSGRLQAVEEAQVHPRVGGTIAKIHFHDGDMVKAGESLFTIDPRPYVAELTRAQGMYESAVGVAANARTDYERAQKLIEVKAIS
ncbi:biotin/lipoyl-binding protein, partial [Escherichia coli]|uniref:efflux RND transporter periplasmic adaptor subunit n=1 Tax=Escherichia coli TaxID=562 RepID=UPI0021F2B929